LTYDSDGSWNHWEGAMAQLSSKMDSQALRMARELASSKLGKVNYSFGSSGKTVVLNMGVSPAIPSKRVGNEAKTEGEQEPAVRKK
jgi:hypothetical protein